jgi:hypothetical protein
VPTKARPHLNRYSDVSPCCCPSSTLLFPSLSQLKILFILQEDGSGKE